VFGDAHHCKKDHRNCGKCVAITDCLVTVERRVKLANLSKSRFDFFVWEIKYRFRVAVQRSIPPDEERCRVSLLRRAASTARHKGEPDQPARLFRKIFCQ
jgi:hypothetical protein